jgi:hypothetical protein
MNDKTLPILLLQNKHRDYLACCNAVLVEIAGEIGFDRNEAKAVLAGQKFTKTVRQE